MKIRGLTELFSTIGEKSFTNQSKQVEKREIAQRAPNPEAVNIASDFGRQSDASDASARREKVEELKAQYESGTYKPDIREVAVAFAKDVFF